MRLRELLSDWLIRVAALVALPALLLASCASNPILSGKPQDWRGKTADELRAGLGEPTKIIPQKDGDIWVYWKTGEFVAPGRENMNFRAGGGEFMARGTVNTTKRSEQVTDYENVWRFLVRGGKVRKWYAQRFEGGQLVWEDH